MCKSGQKIRSTMKDSNAWFIRKEGWLFKQVNRAENVHDLESFLDNDMLQDRPGMAEQS